LENYRLLQERQPEISGALSYQRMLAFLYFTMTDNYQFEQAFYAVDKQ